MAIFVPRSQLTDSVFANAPSFAGAETNWFPQTAVIPGSEGIESGGYFVAKIGQDLVGAQISALPDVIRIDFGGAFAIVDEAYLAHIYVYGHYVIRDKHGQIIGEGVSLLASSGFQSDQLLPALYPEDQVQSSFCKIIVPALPETVTNLAGDTTRWDQLYIVVDGTRSIGWMERNGLEPEDEGRFLLTVGQIEGQRDAQWGDWVNEISFWNSSVPLTDPWYRPDDSVFAGVDSFATGSDADTARAEVSGLTFGDDGTVTWQLGSGGPNIFAMMTQSIQASLGLGADYSDAVNHATGGVLGDLGVETLLTATEAFASDPAISAVAGLASQAKTAVSVKTALVSFNQRNFEIFQGGVEALISGQPFDPYSIDRDLQVSTGQLYTDLALALSGVTGSAVVAAASSYQRISTWLQHSTASLTATFARVQNDDLVTLPAGHSDTFIGDNLNNRLDLGDGDDGAYGAGGNDELHGGAGKDLLMGGTEDDQLEGGAGNDTLNGGANIDTAVFSGAMAAYTISQPSTGVFTITGPDGTDTLTAVEYARFDDALIRLLPGTGVTVNFDTDQPSVYQAAMNAIRDFDGNELGGNGGWLRIGSADVNGDGDIDQILVNRTIGRFAEVGTAPDGKVYFSDYSWGGETRVVGIYIDPLVQSGQVEAGGSFDSQRRFQNDLLIENINRVLGAGDYDHDGLQEVYFKLTDGTAYLHAYMHADGNIRYANYQSQQQVIDFLTQNGWASSTWDGWFG